jgi:hypothetical protein
MDPVSHCSPTPRVALGVAETERLLACRDCSHGLRATRVSRRRRRADHCRRTSRVRGNAPQSPRTLGVGVECGVVRHHEERLECAQLPWCGGCGNTYYDPIRAEIKQRFCPTDGDAAVR